MADMQGTQLAAQDVPVRALLLIEHTSNGAAPVERALAQNRSPLFHVTTATDLAAAPTLLEATPFDVVLLDLAARAGDEVNTLRQILPLAGGTPIIVLMETGDPVLATAVLQQGAYDYLVKGTFSDAFLTRALVAAVTRARVQQTTAQTTLGQPVPSTVGYANPQTADTVEDLVYRYAVWPEYRYEYVNPAAFTLIGYTPEEFYADPLLWQRFIHPDDAEMMLANLPFEHLTKLRELRYIRKDGTTVWVEQQISPLYDHEGRLFAYESVVSDIGARRHAEEQIRFQATLLDAVRNAVIATDLDGTITYWNAIAEQIQGWKAEEVLGREVFDVVTEDSQREQVLKILEHLRAGHSWSGEFLIRHRDGTNFPALVTGSPIFNEAGEVIGLVGVLADLTEQKRVGAALKQSEERFRRLAENAPDMLLHLRLPPDLKVEFVSASATTISGYTPDEWYANPELAHTITHPDDEPIFQQLIQGAAHERPLTMRWVRKDGEVIWIERRDVPVLDDDGQMVAVEAIIRDVTERKRIEDAERTQRELAEALRDTAETLSRELDPDIVMNRILENVEHVVAHDAASVVLIEGDSARVACHRGYPPELDRYLDELHLPLEFLYLPMMDGANSYFIMSDTRPYAKDAPDQRLTWVQSFIMVPIFVREQIIGVLHLDSSTAHFFTDEHARRLRAFAAQAGVAMENALLYKQVKEYAGELERRVEERTAKLRRTTDHLEAVLNSSSDAIILTDLQANITQINPTFSKLFQYEADELLHQPLSLIVDPDYAEAIGLKMREVIETRQPQRIEAVVRCKDGYVFDADLALAPLIEGGTYVWGVECSLRDISARKQLERQLRQMLARQIELNELRSRFISIASHELRTPLAVMRMSSDLLMRYRDRLTQEQRDSELAQIQQGIHRMVELLDDVLTVNRAESGKLEFEPVQSDLVRFSRDIVRDAQKASNHSHRITFSVTGTPVPLYVDTRLVRHILTNLLSNAIKYSSSGSAVEVGLDYGQDRVVFRVEDHGIGIPVEDQQRLFGLFFRAGNVGTIHGTGLGLAIVKQAVELHDGELAYESVEGKGTTFTVSLPKIEVDME